MNIKLFSVTAIAFCMFVDVQGHGRLLEPPSRSSMHRYKQTDPMLIPYRDIIEANYNDNQLYCGGRQVQMNNEGKCGVCGDSYTAAVKENEAGGKYAKGIITRKYWQGQRIDVTVEITAAHKGYFEFRLCPWNNVHIPITHECLDQYLLNFENGETKWYLPSSPSQAVGSHQLTIRLPDDVICSQCVLQWRYRTGNSWGTENGQQGLGLGQQEEFYGCSDVSISSFEETDGSVDIMTTSSTIQASSTTVNSIPAPAATTTDSYQETTENMEASARSTTTETIGIDKPEATDCSSLQLGTYVCRGCHSFDICVSSDGEPYNIACPDGTFCDELDGRCKHTWDVPACSEFANVDCNHVGPGVPVCQDCHSFYICANDRPFNFTCPSGTLCDQLDGGCKHTWEVPSCQ